MMTADEVADATKKFCGMLRSFVFPPKYRYDHLNRYDDAIKILFTFRPNDQDFWHIVYNMVMNDTGDERTAIAEAFRALSMKIAIDAENFRK